MPPKKDENSCGKCNKVVKEGIQCKICEYWWHPACAGIESDICESLGKNQQLYWYCLKCHSSVGKLLKEVMKVQDRMNLVDACVRKMDEKMNKYTEDINMRLNTVLAEVNQNMKKIDEKVCETTPKWSEIVTKAVDSRLNEISGDIDSMQKSVTDIKERIKENEDKLLKINNVILYNVAESDSDSAAERNADDTSFCGELMEKVWKVGYEVGDIVKVIRLGKHDDKLKRSLLVEFANGHVKNVVINNVTNLRLAKDKFQGVTISHDMTVKEWEQCKLLVEEAKKMQNEEMGNYIYRVCGPPGQMKQLQRFIKYFLYEC